MNELKELQKTIADLRGIISDIPTEIVVTDEYGCDEAAFISSQLSQIENLLTNIRSGLPKIEAHLNLLLKS